MNNRILLGFSLLWLSSIAAKASTTADLANDPNYLTIGSISVEEVQGAQSAGPAEEAQLQTKGANDLAALPDIPISEIVNTAKELWQLIEANRPVVNVTTDHANALPHAIQNWAELSNWKAPVSKTFRVQYANLYGMNVVDFTFRVLFTPGGSYKGKGRFLMNATIVPANVSVAWGYTFDAKASVAGVTNAGSTRDPVAAMQLDMHWSVDTTLKHIENTENFYIRGDGLLQQL